MKRYSIVAFAVFASLLVMTATPAAAVSTSLVSAGEHDTATEFQAGTITGDATISGTGSAAVVTLLEEVAEFFDGAEDGDTNEWTLSSSGSGSTYHFTAQTADSFSGSYAFEQYLEPSSSTEVRNETRDVSIQVGDQTNVTLAHKLYTYQNGNPDFNATADLKLTVRLTDGSTETITYRLATVTDSPTSDPSNLLFVVSTHNSETWAAFERNINDDLAAGGYADATEIVKISFEVLTPGNGGGSDIIGMRYDDLEIVRPAETGEYVSDPVSVTNPEEGRVDLTLSGASATVTWQANVGGTWTNVASSTYTTSGTKTASLSSTSAESWRVRVQFEVTGSSPTAELDRDSIYFTDHAPSIDNASASPSGGATVTNSPVELSIDVSDAEFGDAQGEQVTVTFYDASDNSVIGTDTLNSNGTATAEWASPNGGTNQWYAVAEDSYGLQTTSQTFSFEAPSVLRIYNESAPSQLVDNVTVEVQFYFRNGTGPAEIITRNSTNGEVSMIGLPTGQPFIVVAEAQNYTSRRIFVQSLFETQRVYLLPESADEVPVVFSIEDYTGDFPQDDTVLLVQRGINGSWQTVLGDYFGATGQFPAEVERGARFRLVLLNVDTGLERVVGTYTPLTSETQTVTVSPTGDIDVEGLEPTVSIKPSVGVIPAQENSTFTVTVDSRSSTVQSWSLNLTHVPETGTNQTLWSFSSSANGGTTSDTFNLSGLTGELVLEVEFTTSEGTESKVNVYTLQSAPDGFGYSLLGTLTGGLPTLLPTGDWSAFSTMFALITTVLVTAGLAWSTGTTSEMVGGGAVLMLAGWSLVGFLDYSIVFVSGVAWVSITALRRGVI